MEKISCCTIRKDLQERGLSVPVENKQGQTLNITSKHKIPYYWIDDSEGFYIIFNGIHYKAHSIDFDF